MTILLHLKSFFISEFFSPTISSTITSLPCLPFCISRVLIGCVLWPQLSISVSRFPCVCLQHTQRLTYAFSCLGDYLLSSSYITYYRVWTLWCFSMPNVTTSIFNFFLSHVDLCWCHILLSHSRNHAFQNCVIFDTFGEALGISVFIVIPIIIQYESNHFHCYLLLTIILKSSYA